MSPFWNFTSFNDSRPSIFIIFKTGGTKRRSFCRRSRSLQRIFREELMEAKTKERRGEVPPVLVEPKKKCIKKWRVLEEDIYIYIDYISFWNYYGDFWCACFFFVFGGCSWAGWEYYFSNILQLLIHCLNRVIMQVGTFPPTVSLMPAPFVLEELELMTAQLFDGQQVQQAVQKALTSLEATVCGFFRWPWSWKYFRCCSWLQEPLHLTWPMTKL